MKKKITTGIIGVAVAGLTLAGCNGGSVESTSKLPDTFLKIDGAKVYYTAPKGWTVQKSSDTDVTFSTGTGMNEVSISYSDSDEDYMTYDNWVNGFTTDDRDEFTTAPIVESATVGDITATYIKVNYDDKADDWGEIRSIQYLVPINDNDTLMISLYEETDTKTVESDFNNMVENIRIIRTK